MCNLRKGPASKGKRTSGGKLCDASYDGEKESAAVQLEGKVSPGDLIWTKLRGNLWWPAVVVDDNRVYESSKSRNRSEGEVLVRLYGSYEFLYTDPVKYNSEFKMILEQNNGSYHEIFDKALEQDSSRRKSNEPKQQGSKSNVSKQNGGKRKPDSSHAEENASRRNPRRNGSNLEDKSRSRTSEQDELIQKKLKQKSSTKSEQVKNKTHKQVGLQKKLTNSKQSVKDEVNCKSPKQGSVNSKLKSNCLSFERTSPGKSPESIDRRKRVMQGLGLIAPPGSPFHKNGLV